METGETVKEATETEEGLAKRVCGACGYEEEEKILEKLSVMELINLNLKNIMMSGIGYYKEANYTTDSWRVYETALKEAKNILDREDATQEDVDAAIDKLSDAADKLVKKSVDSKEPSFEENDKQNGKTPVTGDSTSIMLWLATAASSAAILKRKKK